MKVWTLLFGARQSLQRELLLNILAALSLCLVIAGVVLISEFKEHLKENLADAMFDEAKELIGQIDPTLPDFGLDSDGLRFQGVGGNFRYTVFAQTGRVIAGSEASDHIWQQLSTLELGTPGSIPLPGYRLGLGLRAVMRGQDLYVLISTFPKWNNETQFSRLLHEIEEGIWWGVLGVVLVIGAALFATRRSLVPLRALSEQAREIGPLAAGRRLENYTVPTELSPLIEDVNEAFDRLEKGYKAQRDFSSNVAHEIRTPIAVLKSSIDRIDDPDLKQTLSQDADQLERIFSQLIDLARSEAGSLAAFEPVDLHALATQTATTFAVEAVRRGRSLSVSGEKSAILYGNAGLLSIALSNLIRNALDYSPEHGEVEIEVLSDPTGWRILDRGPGVPGNLKSALFDRFNRGTQAHASGTGAGLGLAIVQSVAECHGASVTIEDREGGGSIFSFTVKDSSGAVGDFS